MVDRMMIMIYPFHNDRRHFPVPRRHSFLFVVNNSNVMFFKVSVVANEFSLASRILCNI